jgi:23S rRNA (adenine2030-N6)-methyltransferase
MLKEVMPWLVKALAKDAGAKFTLESGKPTSTRNTAVRRPVTR